MVANEIQYRVCIKQYIFLYYDRIMYYLVSLRIAATMSSRAHAPARDSTKICSLGHVGRTKRTSIKQQKHIVYDDALLWSLEGDAQHQLQRLMFSQVVGIFLSLVVVVNIVTSWLWYEKYCLSC